MTSSYPRIDETPVARTAARGRRVLAMLGVWTLILAGLVPATASASAAEESSFIAQVNATRTSRGLQPLQLDGQLTNLARGWAGSMRDGVCGEGSFICHANPISAGVTHPWAKLGENVGTGPDVGSIMAAFIASPSHFANIVDPEFTHIGVGVVWDGSRMFTTHRFMKLQSTAPTTTAPPAPTTTTSPPPTTVAQTTPASTPTTAAPTSAAPTSAAPATTAPVTTAPPTSAPPPSPTAEETDQLVAQPTSVLEKRVVTVLGALAKVTS